MFITLIVHLFHYAPYYLIGSVFFTVGFGILAAWHWPRQ